MNKQATNELGLIIKNEKVVVGSRDISKIYDKRHDLILRNIRSIVEMVPEALHNFVESSYKNEQNREMPEYIMDRQGFSMLVMGFTGQKAKQFTYKYTLAFEEMAQELNKPKQLSAMEQLRLQYQVSEELDTRVTKLEDTMTIDYGQQQELRKLAQSKALEIVGGKDSPVYKDRSVRTKVFSGVWNDFKDYFQVNSYRNTARKELDKAIEYIKGWKPQGKLQREIEDINMQIKI